MRKSIPKIVVVVLLLFFILYSFLKSIEVKSLTEQNEELFYTWADYIDSTELRIEAYNDTVSELREKLLMYQEK